MNTEMLPDFIVSWWQTLTDEERSVLVDNPTEVKVNFTECVRWIINNVFAIPLPDEEAIRLLMRRKNCTEEQAEAKVVSWRTYAQKMNYGGPVAWRVRAGFVLKSNDAPFFFQFIDELNFERRNKEPTKNSLVFWIPRLAEGSRNKSSDRMETLREELREAYDLPKDHCRCFGSINLLWILFRTLLRYTNEFMSLGDNEVMSGSRLNISESDFYCGYKTDETYDGNGFFLIGVE